MLYEVITGFDYLEYRRSLKSLETFPMDEATKFRSSYATASTMGVTVEKLLESIEFYNVITSYSIHYTKLYDCNKKRNESNWNKTWLQRAYPWRYRNNFV